MRRWVSRLVVVALTVSTASVVGPVASGPVAAQPAVDVPADDVVNWADDPWLAVTDRLILMPLLGPLTSAGAQRFDQILGVEPQRVFTMGDGQSQVYSLGEEVSLDEARARGAALVAEGFAARAEPDYRVRRASAPVDDYLWDYQWHLQAVSAGNYGIDVAGLWASTTGSASTVVAVVDTGVTAHPDLDPRNIPVAGQSYPYGYDMIFDDSTARRPSDTGRNPDPTDRGDWNEAGECGSGSSSSWHGTHVAGTIGAATNNGEGVAGVDQQARLVHVRVLGKCGGSLGDVADGIRWAAGLDVEGIAGSAHPARVINLSLGARTETCPTYLQDAISAAVAVNAIVIAAAGNANSAASAYTPANCDGVITVAASTQNGARASYSNYDARVDIAAPGGGNGSSVYSTYNSGTTESAEPNYAGLQGTSMAAPHVAGVVALMLSLWPNLTRPEILAVLQSTATPFPVPTDQDIGPGILNAGALFVGPPTGVTATEGEPGNATVTWNAAPSPATTLNGYSVTPHIAGAAQSGSALSVTSGATAVTFETLANGTAYTFVVESLYIDNRRYSSLPSNEVTPYDVPDAPTVVVEPRDGGVQVSWTAPNTDGGRPITGYVVAVTQVGAGSTVTVSVPDTSTSALVPGLTNGSSYTATVGATNLRGTRSSTPSNAVTPAGVPGTPSIVSTTPGLDYIDVTWTVPSTGGVDLLSVDLEVQPLGGSVLLFSDLPGASTSARVGRGGLGGTALSDGVSYRFRVRATNQNGLISAYSVLSDPVETTDPPELQSVTPTAIIPGGGVIQLVGSALSGVTNVRFVNCTAGVTASAAPSSVTQGAVVVTAPPCSPGNVAVYVERAAEVSNTVTLRYRSVPTIDSLSSSTVSALGGSLVVTGTGFVTDEMWVTVGHQVVSGSAVTVGGDGTTISVALSALTNVSQLGTVGVTVSVLNLAGFTVNTPAFSYVKAPNAVTVSAATSISYQFGMTLPVQAGAAAGTITYTGGGACSFNDTAVALASINGAGTCTLTASASEGDFVLGGSASFDVTVNPGTQTLAFWLPARVTRSADPVTVPLTAIRLSPSVNEGGGEIGFEIIGGAGTVCAVVNGNEGPELELRALGTCTVRATVSATPNFLAGGSASVSMLVVPVPTISSVTPAFVSSDGGTTVTISGSALFVTEVAHPVQLSCGGASVSATSVVFDGTTSAVAVMPACSTIGASHLRVTTSDGSVEFPITVVRAPTISAVSPNFAALGTTPVITITGTGFVVGATTVRLDAGSDIAATVAEGGTSLTFTAPSANAVDLLVDITVTVGGVASAIAEGIFAYQDVPSMPVTVSATAGNQQVELSWAAATPNARSLDGYVVLQAQGAAESPVWTEIVTVSASTRQHIVTGLTNGTSYRFAVLGYNEVGRGEPTVSALATPFTQAAAPTALTTAVQSPGNGVGSEQVVLTWTEGNLGGSALVRHDVEVSISGSSWSSATAVFEGAVATVSGLTNGVTYQLRVRAVTVVGPGLWSDAASATPRDVPNAPESLAVEAKTPTNGLSGTEVLLTWAASVSNGAVVTDYIVERSDGGGWTPATATITGTTATVSGLTPGEQILLRVLAVNGAGTSSASTPVAATARDVPGSPGAITAAARALGNDVPGGGLRITWTAPTVTNGALVTSYVVVAVTASAGTDVAASCEATAPTTQCDLVGLVNGAIYEVSVSAVNSAGVSLPGALGGTASPRDVPSAPGAPTLVVKSVDNEVPGGGLKVTWSAPTSDNGDAIVDYEVVVTVAGVVVASDIVAGLERAFSGLASGVVHSVTVAARNGAGWSPSSDPTTETVRDVPGAPTEVAATPISAVGSQVDGVLRVSWTAPSANGATINRYDVTVSAAGQETKYCDTNGSTFSCDIDGLTVGVAYTVSVSATNAAGMSPEASTTGTPRAVPAAPAAPTVSAKTPTNGVAGGQVVVTWDEPDDRGDPITAYEVTTSTIEGGGYSVPALIIITGTTATISGLTNGVAEFVKVAAVNAAGTSSPSSAGSDTPRDVPGTPTAPVLEVKTSLNGVAATELKASWAVPSVINGAVVTDYEVVVSAAGAVVATHTGSGTTHTFTGLTLGTEYSVTVAALNAAGWSPASAPSTAIARDVPNAPAAPTLVVKAPSNDVPDAGLGVSWTAPHSNGASITEYEVVVSASGAIVATATGSGTTHTFTGLTVGTEYSVTVAALNAAGWSAGSDAATGIPVALPGAPTGLQATAKSPTNGLLATELLLTWTAPDESGGTAITGYVVEGSTDNVSWAPATATITGTTATVSGLTTGAPAYLRVSAVNAAGTSSASPVSATPIDVSGAPTDVAAVGRTPTNALLGTALRVTWTAPASNGGAAITSYEVVATKVGTSDFSLCTSTAPTTQCDVSGLEAVTEYDVVVVAVNGAGTSSASTPVVRASTRDVPDTMAAPTVEAMTSSNVLSSGQLQVIWLEPVSNGAAVTSYSATASATGQTPSACTVAAPTLTCTISGLTDGVVYSVVVSAVNAAGTSTASSATSGTPRTVPGAPTVITLTVRNTTPEGVWNGVGDSAIKVAWTAPASTGGDSISGYTATASAAGQPDRACTVAAPTLTCTISGLTVGVPYSVSVVATNSAGTGPSGAADSPARPLAVPGAPTDVVAVRGDTQLTVTWVAPTLSARGGANIVGYVAQATADGPGITCETTGVASCVISGLTNGSAYTVTVAAVNSAGRGPDSVPSTGVTPAALPSAPATVSAVAASSGELTVSWAAAAGNGSTVTTYSATSVPGGITCSTSGTSCVIGGLTNGTSYTFTVVATNAVGDSVASAASSGVAPEGLPSAPLRVVALPTSNALVVTWEAPVDTGGVSILGYTATASAANQTPRACTAQAPSRTCTISGIADRTTYTVTVTATTRVGVGSDSAPVLATPLAPPSTEQFDEAVAAPAAGALGASDPTEGGTVTVSAGGFGVDEWVIIGISSVPTVLGAVQANGSGEVTTEVALPPSIGAGSHTLFIMNTLTGTVSAQPVIVRAPAVPGAPGQPTVVAGNGTGVADVTFTAPGSDGGATITSYIVTASPGAATCERATAGTCTIVGLVPGTAYTLSVRARNIVGESPARVASASFTPLARPGAANGVTATPDAAVAGRVTVAWSAAASNGAPVSYVARAVQDPSKSCSTTSTTCVITGLPNYVGLTFEVIATNSEGSGPVSAASSAVTLVPPLPTSPREAVGVTAAPVASGTLASGSSASISVGGFERFEWVSIVVQSTPQVLATLQADGNGTVTTTVSVPGGLSQGTHYLTVLSDTRPDGTRRGVTQSFTVASSGGGQPPGGGTPSPGGGSPAPTTFPAERFAGANRYSTSVEISLANFDPGVPVVYLATGANFADALAAGAAAGGAGPVLLVERNGVPTSTLTELGRLQPRRIVVLGGTAAISESVVNAVRALASESVTRLGGADRFETAARISAATFSPNVEVAYVATGANFADALAAGGAARGRGPVLLVRRDGIPDATATELARLRPRRIVVLGGTAVVAASVQTSLATYTTGSVSRVGGADRYATAASLSQSTFAPGVPVVYVATGVNFADALSAAALGAPVLLARPTCLPASTKAELDRLGAERVVVLGGTAALSDDVRRLTVCS